MNQLRELKKICEEMVAILWPNKQLNKLTCFDIIPFKDCLCINTDF